MRKSKFCGIDPEVIAAKERVMSIIDYVDPNELVASIKRAPSLRGMILGYIAEEMFEKHLPLAYPEIRADHIHRNDDHDRKTNKSDRTFSYGETIFRVQLKSIQTNTICRHLESGLLQAHVQNDASDARAITLPNDQIVKTTCYQRGDYDILAVPLFPFTGAWDFAYKKNEDCRRTTSKKYTPEEATFLLSTTEKITWPLQDSWHSDLNAILGRQALVKASIEID